MLTRCLQIRYKSKGFKSRRRKQFKTSLERVPLFCWHARKLLYYGRFAAVESRYRQNRSQNIICYHTVFCATSQDRTRTYNKRNHDAHVPSHCIPTCESSISIFKYKSITSPARLFNCESTFSTQFYHQMTLLIYKQCINVKNG